jgi:hypothetical protein
MRRQGGLTVVLVVASACSSSHRAVDASSPEDANTSLDTEIDTSSALDSGIVADGNAVDWGAAGEAGGSLDSETAGESGTPFTTTSFTQISAGSDHTCGLRIDGSVTCWGSNSYGQAVAPSGTFAQLSAGDQYTCGLRAAGRRQCHLLGRQRFRTVDALGRPVHCNFRPMRAPGGWQRDLLG